MSDVRSIDIVQLRKNVANSFSLSELNVLCFELNIDFEKVPGSEKDEKTVELIRFCQRHGKLLDLIAHCRNARPHIKWSETLQPEQTSLETLEARMQHRRDLGQASRGIHLVHTIRPSEEKDGHWEILIYLVSQDNAGLSIINYAEFFLGPYWENKIFRASNQDNFIGIATLAWGEVICSCRVVFADGYEVMLDRYIDLEMAKFFSANEKNRNLYNAPENFGKISQTFHIDDELHTKRTFNAKSEILALLKRERISRIQGEHVHRRFESESEILDILKGAFSVDESEARKIADLLLQGDDEALFQNKIKSWPLYHEIAHYFFQKSDNLENDEEE